MYSLKKVALAALFSFFVITLNAQQVTGVVRVFKNYPLQNVKVKSLKTGNMVITDSDGKFSIAVSPDDKLIFSAEGFFEKKLKVEEKNDFNVELKYKFDDNSFRDAVGNHHISESDLQEALKAYPGKGEKDYSKYKDIFDLIRAEIRTVRVSGNNVFSTKSMSFSLPSQVLYVVNDIIVNDISYISPTEIRKIVFLDDDEAAEYGMRGANGVIKITLKSR